MTDSYDYYGYGDENDNVDDYPEEAPQAPPVKQTAPPPPPQPELPNGHAPRVLEDKPVKPVQPAPPKEQFPSPVPKGATPAAPPLPTTNGTSHSPSLEDDPLQETSSYSIAEDFDDMNLKDELARGIYSYGFEKPSAIQQRAIIPCIKGRDIIAQAQSGTGKTATFAISILQRVDVQKMHVQAMILAPTRELAQQIQKVRHGGRI
eukprot:TRINITY_DN172_c0_g1_i3.p2 TRINITY_DN172_c0_g1~~TRINITY_DN172_c0_g1_i3.p2  ORF type:complete len:205 (-),score=48.72 TRINITY_DN172_c0_g1_i3:1253-1867(-)